MSGAIQAVLGVVEIVVGTLGSEIGLGFLVPMGVATLLGYAASLLQNPHRAPLIPIGASYAGSLEPRRMLCGTPRMSARDRTP